MKKTIVLCISIAWACALSAQNVWISQTLDTNQIKTSVPALPILFTNFMASTMEAPKGSGKSTIYASSLWIGGVSNNNLYTAAETYRQAGRDFKEGAISTSYPAVDSVDWDYMRLWTLTRKQINQFKEDFKSGTLNFSKYPNIWSWPVLGKASRGQASNMASYIDVNKDGVYNPMQGDYPAIKGDYCIYFIYHDDIPHTETGGQTMKAEIHRMVYAFAGKGKHLDNTIFTDYKIFNRSNITYDSAIVSVWTDFDIGNYADDYVGTDVLRNMVFGYNGDSVDEGPNGYGTRPPAQALVFLNQELGGSMYYENDQSIYGNPSNVEHYWNYMNGIWKDNAPKTKGGKGYGGTELTKFSFDGNPCDNTGWWEGNVAGNQQGDRRILASVKPFVFKPGDSYSLTTAYVFARASSGNHLSSVCELRNAVDDVKSFFLLNQHEFIPTGIADQKLQASMVNLYPNPAKEVVYIEVPNEENLNVSITDLSGKTMIQTTVNNNSGISTQLLGSGLYFVTITTSTGSVTKKLIID